MELRAKKRPLGHRNMSADAYYPCVVVGVNDDGSMVVRYPDEGRRGIEDDGLTIDLVDLESAPKKGATVLIYKLFFSSLFYFSLLSSLFLFSLLHSLSSLVSSLFSIL